MKLYKWKIVTKNNNSSNSKEDIKEKSDLNNKLNNQIKENSNKYENYNLNNNIINSSDKQIENISNLSDLKKEKTYLEKKEKLRDISSLSEDEINENNSYTTNSHIIDDINLSIIPYEDFYKVYKNISEILYKSTFIYNINTDKIKIKYKENNIRNYDDFVRVVQEYKNKIYELFEHFSKLINYLDKVKQKFKNEFKDNLFGLEIKMDLITNQINSKYIHNINYDYKINDKFKNKCYEDIDIFKNEESINLYMFIEMIKFNEIYDKHTYNTKSRNNVKGSEMAIQLLYKELHDENMQFYENNYMLERMKNNREFQRIRTKEYDYLNLKEELNNFFNDKILSNLGKEDMDSKNIIDIQNILKESTIILNINDKEKEGQNLYDFKDYSLIEKNVNFNEFKQKLEQVKNKQFEYDIIFKLIDNYEKLILFIEEIKKRIKNKIKGTKIKIKLKFKQDSNKNISCEYILIEPSNIKFEKTIYKDNNILRLKDYSDFDSFLDELIKRENIHINDEIHFQQMKMEMEHQMHQMELLQNKYEK